MSGLYRSAMNKAVDMGAMISRNEKIRAVGNMNVNARGDILDSNNKIIQDSTKRVKEAYKATVRQSGTMPQEVDLSELSAEERLLEDDDTQDIVKK